MTALKIDSKLMSGTNLQVTHTTENSAPSSLVLNDGENRSQFLLPLTLSNIQIPYDKVFSGLISFSNLEQSAPFSQDCIAVLKKGAIGLVGNQKNDELWVLLDNNHSLDERMMLNTSIELTFEDFVVSKNALDELEILG